MTRLTTWLLAAALVVLAMAQGTDHEVRIERRGFYPGKVYVQEGDTITFTNHSIDVVGIYSDGFDDNYSNYNYDDPCDYLDADDDGNVEFSGSKDGFRLPNLGIGQSYTLDVTGCMETQFYEPYLGYSFNGSARLNLVVFGEAPNG